MTTVVPLSACVTNYVYVISYEFFLGLLQSIVLISYMLNVNDFIC
jgi:hypothetical protein